MVEFFQSIGNWFVENKDQIIAVLTSTNFVAFITMIITAIRQHQSIKTNTQSNLELSTKLQDNTKLSEGMSEAKKELDDVKVVVNTVETDLLTFKSNITEELDMLMSKINAILEVQSIVYSTIKDEAIRESIHGILTTAKCTETTTMAKLEEEIIRLKQQIETKIETVKEDVKEVLDTATKVKKTSKNSTPRC